MRRSSLVAIFAISATSACSGEVAVETTGTGASTSTTESGAGGSSGGAGGEGGGGSDTGGGGVLEASNRRSCADKDLQCAGHSCCAASFIPGGSYNRLNDPAYPATVSSFWLDMFEVTVGRMRAFVEAYPSSKPALGAGAHPKFPESGWTSDLFLHPTQEDVRHMLGAVGFPEGTMPKFTNWTDEVGPNENRPVTFVIWEVAQAFCIWDGGRLPTEAEWNYAAVGGDQQRTYPWGEQPPTPKLAALNYNEPGGPYDMADRDVGSVPAGAGRWGQLDLSGGRMELMFDANLAPACCEVSKLPVPCDDCLVLPDAAQEGRIIRDQSAFHLANVDISNEERDEDYFELTQVDVSVGFRCVYVPEDN